jgi:hypothetical protein|nr:MAG TPA: hypothetical protein [Caudoviricetes sp.]
MNIYLIERTNKETGETRTEVVKAPFLAVAFLEQETEYGKGYTYKLAEHLKVSTADDHNKEYKDNLDRIHQYQKTMAESSYTNPFTSPYRDDPDMAKYVDTTSRLTSNKQARLRKLLQNNKPRRGGII